MLIFEALTVECVEFQLLTIDYMHIYGRMCSDSTPSLVYRVKMCIAAVTISLQGGVTPIDCIVTAVTAGQNLDLLFPVFNS